MREFTKAEIASIARRHSIDVSDDWSGPAEVWPLCEKMMNAGSVVIIKLDGERISEDDNGKFTVIAMDGLLAGSQIRGDFETLDEGLCYLIGNYDAITNSIQS